MIMLRPDLWWRRRKDENQHHLLGCPYLQVHLRISNMCYNSMHVTNRIRTIAVKNLTQVRRLRWSCDNKTDALGISCLLAESGSHGSNSKLSVIGPPDLLATEISHEGSELFPFPSAHRSSGMVTSRPSSQTIKIVFIYISKWSTIL